MRKFNLTLFMLPLIILFLATGCSSNESKAEKLVKTAEQFADNLDYAQAIPAYIDAYNLTNSDAYKERVSELVCDQYAILSIKEYMDTLIELSEDLSDKFYIEGTYDPEHPFAEQENAYEDFFSLKPHMDNMLLKTSAVLDYMRDTIKGSDKIEKYVSDIVDSKEYKSVTDRLQLINDTVSSATEVNVATLYMPGLYLDFCALSDDLKRLAKLYDFPQNFRAYSVSVNDAVAFGLSERVSLEVYLPQRLGENNPISVPGANHAIIEGRNFSDGVAWIKFPTNWACVDKTGTVLFELDRGSEPSTDFRGGIAIVDKDKIIDKMGNVVYGNASGQYDSIILSSYQGDWKQGTTENFNGLVFVKKHIDTFELTEDRIGIIDANGDWYLEPVNYMQYPHYLGDGMYRIWTVSKGYESESCIYNSQKKIFFTLYKPNRSIDIGLHYTDGYSIHVGGEHVGYLNYSIDKSGNYMEFACEEVSYEGIVNNGLHTISKMAKYSDGVFFGYGEDKHNNYKGKFYDKEGKVILDISHLNVLNEPYFVNGYCLLDLRNNQGSEYFTIIDTLGNMIFEPLKLLPHGNLHDGIYWTMENGVYTYRNVQGIAVFTLPVGIETACDFSEGLLRVESPSGTYYVDTDGNTVFGSVGEISSAASYDVDYEKIDNFITFIVEKEGQMYDIEPLEFDINNYDLTKLLQFTFVKWSPLKTPFQGDKKSIQ